MPAPPNVAGASRVRPYRRRPAAGFLSRGGSRIDHPSNVFVALKLKPLTFAGMQMQEGFQRLRVTDFLPVTVGANERCGAMGISETNATRRAAMIRFVDGTY